jgi:hypothetical protein
MINLMSDQSRPSSIRIEYATWLSIYGNTSTFTALGAHQNSSGTSHRIQIQVHVQTACEAFATIGFLLIFSYMSEVLLDISIECDLCIIAPPYIYRTSKWDSV